MGWKERVRLSSGLAVVAVVAGGTPRVRADVGTLADSNGQVVAWGYYPAVDVPAGTYRAIAGGGGNTLYIRSDGTLMELGDNQFGQRNNLPVGTFKGIAAGGYHGLAIRDDGTLAGWGMNNRGQATVPAGTYVAVAAGYYHSLAIKSDGTLTGWGSTDGGVSVMPAGTFSAIAAGGYHSVALRTDGTAVAWGANGVGQSNVPGGTFAAVSAGYYWSLGLRPDGSLVAWGDNGDGERNVPGGTFAAIAAGAYYGLALRADGTLAAWGANDFGQRNVPAGQFVSIAADDRGGVAMRARTVYDGDLLVAGAGVGTNLNRSVSVAGSATIQTTMTLYNNAVMSVGGTVAVSPAGRIQGAGTVIGDVLAQAGSVVTATGALALGRPTSPGGFYSDGTLNVGAQQVTLLDADVAQLGAVTTVAGGRLTSAGGFYLAAGRTIGGNGRVQGDVTGGGSLSGSGAGLSVYGDVSGIAAVGGAVRVYGRWTSAGLAVAPGSTVQVSGDFSNGGATVVGRSSVVKVSGALANGGTIDLTDAVLVLDSTATSLGAIEASIGGALFSSSASGGLVPMVVDNARAGLTEIDGVPLAPTDTVVRWTVPGDVSGDGVVDLGDLNAVLNRFGAAGVAGAPLFGDTNRDRRVDLSDLNDVLNHFGARVSDGVGAPVLVPEPSLVITGVVVATGLTGRRRRQTV